MSLEYKALLRIGEIQPQEPGKQQRPQMKRTSFWENTPSSLRDLRQALEQNLGQDIGRSRKQK